MAIEQLVEEVASNFEEAAEVTRQINPSGLTYLGIGVGIGIVVGFYVGYNRSKEKLRAEAIKEAEEEIGQIREVYLQKMVALENADKPSVQSIVAEHGYSVAADTSQFRLPSPVPILSDLPELPTGTSKSKNANWSYELELEGRSPTAPYVIHEDEYHNSQPDYTKVEYVYYAEDDVLVDVADGHPLPHGDMIVGQDNLKFGHGSSDSEIVYVRNDRLNSDMQITRLLKSYEEEVMGMSRDDDDSD